ncbi:hypothetical protein H6G89_33885 [Oscillatoria sp. FACHB-1407]|nr:hypothetical protein [Oscillatoria sp. FACHB-1407]
MGTVTLQSGETITYDYDGAGRVQSEVTRAADGTVTGTLRSLKVIICVTPLFKQARND